METVVNLFASRNYQKVKNEVVTTIEGMTKVIYDYLDRYQNEESASKPGML